MCPLAPTQSSPSLLLGLYFQVRDDYANLCMEDMHDNKSFAEDLTEGKFSFPIVHAITYVFKVIISNSKISENPK